MSATTIRIPAVRCTRCRLAQAPATTQLCVSCTRPTKSCTYRHVPPPESTPTIPAPPPTRSHK